MSPLEREVDWWSGFSPEESPAEVAEMLDNETGPDAISQITAYRSWAEQLAAEWPDMFPGDPLPQAFVERVVRLLVARAE